jgi:type II secretory pathway pseudopilin PulG
LKKSIFNEKGLTLIEILLAMTLLTIVLVTFMAIFTNAFQYNAKTSDKVKGVNLVREKEASIKIPGTDGDAFKTFMGKVKNNTVVPDDYIAIVKEGDKSALNDGVEQIDEYYKLQFNSADPNYTIFIYVKTKPDFPNTDLYRLYIETIDKNNNMLSKTYSYYQYK